MRADRKARHYTGNLSEINVGREPYYGTREVDGGPGSANCGGALKSPRDAELEARRDAEVKEARRMVKEMRRRKDEKRKAKVGKAEPKKDGPKHGKGRLKQQLPDDWEGMQREIAEANQRYERGEITLRECNEIRDKAIIRRLI